MMWAVMSMSESARATDDISFSDTQGHWAESAINDMVKEGVLEGFPDGTFRPDDPVQVDQFLKMILMSLSEEDEHGVRDWKEEFISKANIFVVTQLAYKSSDFHFENAANGYWAEPFIDQASTMSILGKYSRFESNYRKDLNREDVAHLVSKTISMFEEKEEFNYMNLAKGQIKDLYLAQHDEQDILQVYMKGIMRGYPDGTFGVTNMVTRAEAAELLSKILNRKNRDPYQPDLSTLPHDIVSTEFGREKIIVFPGWDMKYTYDTLKSNLDKSTGYTVVESNRINFYKDEETYYKNLERFDTLYDAFSPALHDISVIFDTSMNQYEIHISTAENALIPHEGSISSFLNLVFESDSDKFLKHAKNYVDLARDGQLNMTNDKFNSRKVIFSGTGDDNFLYIAILPN